jgi:mediator of RNA polymerase II transcription subunit 31
VAYPCDGLGTEELLTVNFPLYFTPQVSSPPSALMASPSPSAAPPPPSSSSEPLYADNSRFTLELEFVTLLGSPPYLSYLATTKLLQNPQFIAYLKYLLYWTKPEYVKYLMYPGPTLKALELLQVEGFRRDVLRPEVVGWLAEGFLEGG